MRVDRPQLILPAATPSAWLDEGSRARLHVGSLMQSRFGEMVGCVAVVVVGIKIFSAIDSFSSNDEHSPPQVPSRNLEPC